LMLSFHNLEMPTIRTHISLTNTSMLLESQKINAYLC